jgi:hypothetical protein
MTDSQGHIAHVAAAPGLGMRASPGHQRAGCTDLIAQERQLLKGAARSSLDGLAAHAGVDAELLKIPRAGPPALGTPQRGLH